MASVHWRICGLYVQVTDSVSSNPSDVLEGTEENDGCDYGAVEEPGAVTLYLKAGRLLFYQLFVIPQSSRAYVHVTARWMQELASICM